MIPFLDLRAANAPMQAATEAALERVARSPRYILGPEVEAFEAEWAAYCGVRHCVGTGNALDALRMVLMAWEIGAGDEVLVPSNTYIATWLAVSLTGALPVPVEPDPATFNMDPAAMAAAITPKTRAVIAVHLYGRLADMERIRAVARLHGLPVLEDAAQAHGACDARGRRAGALGHAAAFSFYPTKNLGALGDAGAVTTDDTDLAAAVRRLRSYGGGALCGRIDHQVRGINSRLDEIQAAVLRAKLPFLDAMNQARRERAGRYCETLDITSLPLDSGEHVFHQFVLRLKGRDAVRREMAARGIDCHVHYPVPPHREPAYAAYAYARNLRLPLAERLAHEVLSLPIGYEVDVELIADALMQEACAHA